MLQSMHTGSYFVKLILKKEAVDNKLIVSACQASCECAAGYVHIIFLLSNFLIVIAI